MRNCVNTPQKPSIKDWEAEAIIHKTPIPEWALQVGCCQHAKANTEEIIGGLKVCEVGVPVSEVKSLSHVQLFATPWTVAYQAPSMGFSRQEYWGGLPLPSPGDLPDPGIEPRSPTL